MTGSLAVGQWVIGTTELVSDALQIAPLKLENGNPITATTETCCCPFDLGSQQGNATRKNLDLRLSQEWASRIDHMEHDLVNLVARESDSISMKH